MTHQVLEEYNSLPTTQTTNRVPQTKLLKLLNTYLLMVTFENGENYSIWFEVKNTICIALHITVVVIM